LKFVAVIGEAVGSTKSTQMMPTQTIAVHPTTALHLPRFHGPTSKSGRSRRSRTGVT
jgi:hypothetical protein